MNKIIISGVCLAAGCLSEPTLEEGDSSVNLGVIESELSEVTGCHFYVGSYYGGSTLWMPRSSTISDLHAKSMGDKISSLRLRGGATTRLWIDRNYQGNSWYISYDVSILHTGYWGNLGDNASSVDCY